MAAPQARPAWSLTCCWPAGTALCPLRSSGHGRLAVTVRAAVAWAEGPGDAVEHPGDRYQRIELMPLARHGGGVQLSIYSGPMAGFSRLSQDEAGTLAEALLSALRALQALFAGGGQATDLSRFCRFSPPGQRRRRRARATCRRRGAPACSHRAGRRPSSPPSGWQQGRDLLPAGFRCLGCPGALAGPGPPAPRQRAGAGGR